MLTLHHLNHSRSFRILWLLEELKAHYGTKDSGIDYTLINHNRNKPMQAPNHSLR